MAQGTTLSHPTDMETTTSTMSRRSERRRRFEYRVWGHWEDASRRLAKLADLEQAQDLHDCYLLLGDPACNAKIRRRRLKVKRLVEVKAGFHRWSTEWHRRGPVEPKPLAEVLTTIRSMKESEISDRKLIKSAIDELQPEVEVRPVFVTKHRQRFWMGPIRAEACEVEIRGQKGYLSTMAIEGPELGDLRQLRSALGLSHLPNLPLHVAVGQQHLGWC